MIQIELRTSFEMFDSNGDGTISAEELHQIIEKCDVNLTNAQFEELVDNLDKDDDDKIQFEGFVFVFIGVPDLYQT